MITGFTVFTDMQFSTLDWRCQGQALPAGSIPVCMENLCTGQRVELVDGQMGLIYDDGQSVDSVCASAREQLAAWA